VPLGVSAHCSYPSFELSSQLKKKKKKKKIIINGQIISLSCEGVKIFNVPTDLIE